MNLAVSVPILCLQLGRRLLSGRYRTDRPPGTNAATPPVSLSLDPKDYQNILPQSTQIELHIQAVRLLDGAEDATGLSFSTIDIAAPIFDINQDPPHMSVATIQQCDPCVHLSPRPLSRDQKTMMIR